jgi:hypothetical protein
MMNISVTTELLMAPEKSELRDWRDITLIHDVDVDEPLCCEEHVTGTGTCRLGGERGLKVVPAINRKVISH